MALLRTFILVLTLSVFTLGSRHTARSKSPSTLRCIIHSKFEAHCTGHSPSYPDLLNADLEDLVDGLKDGDFTSVKLTKVCFHCLL